MSIGLQGLYGGFSAPQFMMPNPLEEIAKSWEDSRAKLGQRAGRFDQTARAQLNDLNAKTDAIQKAYQEKRLTREEYLQAVADIKNNAEEFRWQSHDMGEGSMPGDIIEVDGVQKLRDQNGLTPIGYTPDYIQKNTVEIGDSGQVAVPVGPGKPYSIVKREQSERNAAEERAGIEEMRLQIAEQYDKMVNQVLASSAGQPVGEQQLNELATAAGEIVAQRYEHAKNLYTRIMDSGVDDRQRAVRGQSPNPYAEKVRAAMQPEPSMSPVPGMPPGAPPAPQQATAGPQMVAGAPSRPIPVSSPEEMAAMAAQAPDGTLFETPDGRLYQQEGGRPMQLAGNVPMQRGASGMLTYAGMPEEEQLAMMRGEMTQTAPQAAPEPEIPLTERERLMLMKQQMVAEQQMENNRISILGRLLSGHMRENGEITPEEYEEFNRLSYEMVGARPQADGSVGQAGVPPAVRQALDDRLGALQEVENRLARVEGRKPRDMASMYRIEQEEDVDTAEEVKEQVASAGAAVGGSNEEAAFQQWWNSNPDVLRWRSAFKAKYGEEPPQDAPEYDYRAAFQAGVVPKDVPYDDIPHWALEFKGDSHPNRFIKRDGVIIDTKNGRPATEEEILRINGPVLDESELTRPAQAKRAKKPSRKPALPPAPAGPAIPGQRMISPLTSPAPGAPSPGGSLAGLLEVAARPDLDRKVSDQILSQAAKTMSSDPVGQMQIANAQPVSRSTKPSEIPAGTLVRRPDGQVFMKLNNGRFVPVE